MTNRKIGITFEEFLSIDELSPQDKELALKAIEAQKGSYAPYSHFNVGAAVLLDNGEIVLGSNQENAASPSGLCAERTAMFYASSKYPGAAMTEIAIVGGPDFTITDDPCTPCGACRQVMAEYQKIGGKPMANLWISKNRIWKFSKVEDVLPFIFDSLDK